MKGQRISQSVQVPGKIASYLLDRGGTVVALGSIVSLIIAIALKVKLLTPLLITSVIAPFLVERLKSKDARGALRYILNWAITIFIFCAAISVFIPERAKEAFPYAEESMTSFTTWIRDPGSSSPYGLKIALLGAVAVFIASLISGGIGGLIILAGSLCSAAFAFVYIARHADNLVHIALIGLPPWEIAAFLAAFFLVIPAASLSLRKFSQASSSPSSNHDLYIYFWIGISLLAFAALTNLALSNAWSKLIGNCTIL